MIELNQLVYVYDNLCMQFDFSANKGEMITIVGPSGAGKSTLLNLIAGFLEPTSGQIYLNGQNHTNILPDKRPVSMLFQSNNVFTHLTVRDNLALGITPSLKLTPSQHLELLAIAKKIGLTDYLSAYPEKLSGGQKQRIAIGRCLLQRRPILLLDEPFSSLDPKLKKEMFALLYDIQAEYCLTVLMVTHQLDDISSINHRSLMIVDGKIVFDGDYATLIAQDELSVYLGMV